MVRRANESDRNKHAYEPAVLIDPAMQGGLWNTKGTAYLTKPYKVVRSKGGKEGKPNDVGFGQAQQNERRISQCRSAERYKNIRVNKISGNAAGAGTFCNFAVSVKVRYEQQFLYIPTHRSAATGPGTDVGDYWGGFT